ncbi:MAG: lipopolysaccharide kinase InaA family protein [Phycisphaerales bacterium]
MAKENIKFIIKEEYHSWLEEMNLHTFEQLMFSEVGSVVEKGDRNEILRIEGAGRTVYLKRRLICSVAKSIESYLFGTMAYSAPFREYLHICSLQKFQFPVMNCIAVGEKRKWGMPQYGFILVDEVKGTPLDKVLNLTNMQDKDVRLPRSYGTLLARLHRHGFYGSLRLKDIIVMDSDQSSIVMIDREARYSHPRCRWAIRARNSLNRSFRRIRRTSPEFNQSHIDIVKQAYNDCMQNRMD